MTEPDFIFQWQHVQPGAESRVPTRNQGSPVFLCDTDSVSWELSLLTSASSEDINVIVSVTRPVTRPDDFFAVEIGHRICSDINAAGLIVNSCKNYYDYSSSSVCS